MTGPGQTRGAENAEPHEQNNPVPRVLIGLIAALVVWAVCYIYASSPNGAAALGDRRAPATLAAGAAPQQGVLDGRQIFTAACQACHQAAGQGLAGVFPPLAGSAWVAGAPDLLAKIVLHGMNGPIEVAGVTYSGAMPAFGGQFSDAELAAVLTFIRQEWGNRAPALDAAMVEAARKATAGRAEPWKGAEDLLKHGSPAAGGGPAS
ncbi:c-type cytochrome [Pollutimonas bauzanensis]|uniref:Cytochrome c, mono-and diheme variants n=1 Tax=Pollutimonas bauzanensis TaxID=658167 RepID=A0A1M5TD60_9BURK|nr:c-type cytochrome [Pollutimonas bauzanensis]SHH48658.1 Cytochrome c, mono-and diheme variants [Pollutimonas bauzanensis]